MLYESNSFFIKTHIHIRLTDKKAKIWIEPSTSLAENKGFSSTEISNILKEVQKHERIIREESLRWDAIDVDLEIDSIIHPECYPISF